MDATRRLALKVGLLVFLGVVIAFMITVILGSESLWFRPKTTYYAAFPDVAGLKEGAVVRVGGRDVGLVTEISFSTEPAAERALTVQLRLNRGRTYWVRVDSVATIEAQGLLGDKLVAIGVGSANAPRLPDGAWIRTTPPADPVRLIAVATEAATHARDILARLDMATQLIDWGAAATEATGAFASLRRVLDRIENGPGSAHEMVYGPDLVLATRSVAAALDRVEGAAAEIERILADIKTTPPAPDILVAAARAAENLAEVTAALDPAALRRAVRDLTEVMAWVRSGRGSLGGLLMDPTLYEETKRALVNIRRNRILRALARFAIERGGEPESLDAGPGRVEIRPRRAPRPTKQAGTPPAAQ